MLHARRHARRLRHVVANGGHYRIAYPSTSAPYPSDSATTSPSPRAGTARVIEFHEVDGVAARQSRDAVDRVEHASMAAFPIGVIHRRPWTTGQRRAEDDWRRGIDYHVECGFGGDVPRSRWGLLFDAQFMMQDARRSLLAQVHVDDPSSAGGDGQRRSTIGRRIERADEPIALEPEHTRPFGIRARVGVGLRVGLAVALALAFASAFAVTEDVSA